MQSDDLMSKQFLHFQSIFADNICEYIMFKFYLYSQYVIGDTISISICILFPICICWYNQWYHGGHNTRPPISQQFPRGSLIEERDDENDNHVVIFFFVCFLVLVPSYRIYPYQEWCVCVMLMLYLYFLYSFDDTISISICILFPICICWYNQWYHGGHNTRPPISQQFPRGSLIEARDDENDNHVVIFSFFLIVVVPVELTMLWSICGQTQCR